VRAAAQASFTAQHDSVVIPRGGSERTAKAKASHVVPLRLRTGIGLIAEEDTGGQDD
jgi:hypothetical protein